MSVKTALRDWLKANVPAASNRVFANRLRQKTPVPSIVVETESAIRTSTIDGVTDATKETSFSLDCIAEKESESETVADQVEDAIDAVVGTATMGEYDVEIRVDDRSDDWFDNQAAEDKGRYITTVDVVLFYTKEAP